MGIETLAQAEFFIERGRFAEGEQSLRMHLASNPSDPNALMLLAVCLHEQQKSEEALSVIEEAIHLDPQDDRSLYIRAVILFHLNKDDEAEAQIRAAITNNPYDADFFGLLANIYLQKKDFQTALQYAEEGLAVNAEHVLCLNMKYMTQVKLGIRQSADRPMDNALRLDPDDPTSHAVYGWGLLEENKPKEALHHFREALRLDPTNGMARSGMVEALKARYWFYRIFLQFFFWMGNQGSRMQWGIIIGFYILFRILRNVSETKPGLQPILTPLLILMAAFALLTWIIEPLSNLLLRINPYGRYALTEDQRRSSSFVGIGLATAVLAGLGWLISQQAAMAVLAIVGGSMMLPLGNMFRPKSKKKRRFMITYSIAMLSIGLLAVVSSLGTGEIFTGIFVIYLLLFVAFQWIANFIAIEK